MKVGLKSSKNSCHVSTLWNNIDIVKLILMVFSLYCGFVGKCSYSQEMHNEVFRGELSSCLQITSKWLTSTINNKSIKTYRQKESNNGKIFVISENSEGQMNVHCAVFQLCIQQMLSDISYPQLKDLKIDELKPAQGHLFPFRVSQGAVCAIHLQPGVY